MEIINPALLGSFISLIKSISKDKKIALLHHTDPDGITSGVIISKLIEKVRDKPIDLRLNQGQNELQITDETISKLDGIDILIITDMSVDQNPEPLIKLSSSKKIIILDHHKLYNDLNSQDIILIKPQLLFDIEDSAAYCAAKLCYDLASKITDMSDHDWLAAIGIIGDCAVQMWLSFIKDTFSKYSLELDKDMFNTQLGRCADLISSAESYSIDTVEPTFNLVYNASSYKDILTSQLSGYKQAIQAEIDHWLNNAKKFAEFYADIKLIFYLIKPKYSIKSTVCTMLSFQYPDHTIIVIQDMHEKKLPFSARRRDKLVAVNDLLEKATKNLDEATAGGHIPAAGGKILRDDLDLFRKNIISLLSSEKSTKSLSIVWKKIQDKASGKLNVEIKTVDKEGSMLAYSGLSPYFCELVKSKASLRCQQCLKTFFPVSGKISCHANLCLFAVPINLNDTHIATMVAGPFKDSFIPSFASLSASTTIGEDEFAEAYQKLPVLRADPEPLLTFIADSLPELALSNSVSEKKLEQLEITNKITNMINSTLELPIILNEIINFMLNYISARCCSILIFDKNQRFMPTQKILPEPYKRFENIIAKQVCEYNKIIAIQDIPSDTRFKSDSAFNLYKTLLSIPIRSKEHILGTITLYSDSLDDLKDKVDFLKMVSNHAALAILNAQQFESIKQLAVTDKLTGFYNRRKFMDILEKEVQRSSRLKNPLSIAMIDVDHFSHYNNTHGHPAGDKLLKKLSDTLRKNVREIDTIGRYGGEEFIIIFPETKPHEIHTVASRLVKAVESEKFDLEHTQPLGSITISMGLLTCMDGSLSPEEMIKIADESLYKAKNTGRNKLVARVIINRNMRPVDVN